MKASSTPRALISSALVLTLAVLPASPAAALQPAGDEGESISVGEGDPDEGESVSLGEGEGEAAPEGEGEGESVSLGEGEGEAAPEGEGAEQLPAEGEGVEEPAEGEASTDSLTLEGPEDDSLKEPTFGRWKAKGTGMLISGGILLGLGAAGLVTSIVLTNCPEPANTIGCDFKDNRTFLVPIAGTVITAGIVLLTVGAITRVKYKRWQERVATSKQAMLTPTFTASGAGLSYSMRF